MEIFGGSSGVSGGSGGLAGGFNGLSEGAGVVAGGSRHMAGRSGGVSGGSRHMAGASSGLSGGSGGFSEGSGDAVGPGGRGYLAGGAGVERSTGLPAFSHALKPSFMWYTVPSCSTSGTLHARPLRPPAAQWMR